MAISERMLLARCLICVERQASKFIGSHASTSAAAPVAVNVRPQLDFDFMLNPSNTDAIKRNIKARKGVGDIEKVRWWNFHSRDGASMYIEGLL